MNPGCTLIVGAGLAGSRCAETLRAEGYTGRIVVVGDEPHPPYERPALSKELLAGKRSDLELRPRSFWDELEIELRLGTRVPADPSGARFGRTPAEAEVEDAGAETEFDLALVPERSGTELEVASLAGE